MHLLCRTMEAVLGQLPEACSSQADVSVASEDHVDIEYLLMLGADVRRQCPMLSTCNADDTQYEESIRASLLERPPAEVSESLGSIMDFYLARVDAVSFKMPPVALFDDR